CARDTIGIFFGTDALDVW
nr:immunoglobulin heavy chain junction region [Macaca mulatta]MOY21214.1 immunoglobulin heavy chain junction region [Macaca mulatta]MOY21226.1 immunoglobulin heavy chain junction region [Macaca mulatta]MOY21553.1 immunoglobulin heavy chain junction region [Macaca mulatta]MOY22239.1 immunoglobulin heavy chain junction region [Macaca mulatta]